MNPIDFPGLATLRPFEVQQYLLGRGWTPVGEPKNDVIRYRAGDASLPHARMILDVLLDTTFGDYERRMAELVQALARIEGRSMPEVIDELSVPPE